MRILLLLLTSFAILVRPASAADHPGNVFLAGDDVRVTLPKTWAGWRAIDIDRKEVGHGDTNSGAADLGKLPVGYFEVREKDGPGMVTTAVLEKATISDDTPIAIDVAASWFYADPGQICDACKICKLAGVKWIRDRLSWPELEGERGKWAAETRYEKSMRIQHEAGLKILQVNHASPSWASKDSRHFPEDLRDVYAFYRDLAKRWNGLADAIEPWNEPDLEIFGGHTGCEIASFQKAAFLGLKAGDPKRPVNQAVFAIDRAETLEEFGRNEVYPYFDRYDLHHYIALPAYARAYGRHRAVSGGRPLWTTEFNLTIFWADEKTHEPSEDNLRVQGYRVSKVFSNALYEGCVKAFYFMLGHYVERNLQYGIVHTDLTPRPAYVAFAAVGRLLNAAKPIGRIDFGNEKLKGYAFRTEINGAPRETLVAWSETKPKSVKIAGAEQMYDYLGRKLPLSRKAELTRSPTFFVLPSGGSKALTIVPPPAKAKWLDGKASTVVLQLLGKTDFKKSTYLVDQSGELKLVAYNFGDKPARGKLSIRGAKAEKAELEVAPGAREELTIKSDSSGKVTARLELGDDEHAIVSANVQKAQLKN
jgi:hypothetical protein